ncbi:MAG: TetR/AcrR family transcriptional regulator [Deltaproteobacteria bacterium]|nr:TetR/AcrR family transcriptional regulator [Deltaproteobacteria bacterium]MBW2445542.1 TetR/AcrR family transcriptional regulator [Deltaproteobacteria bacterium]
MSSTGKSSAKGRPAGRPVGSTAEATRVEILDAALEAFSEAGFEAMSVRELTRRLGVSHNLVHHHFGSKEDLWRAALDHGAGPTANELLELLGQSVGSPDSKRILRTGMESGIELLRRRPAVARIVVDESARPGPRLDYLYERYLGPMVETLSRFLANSQLEGFRDVEPRVATLYVLSSVSAPFAHAALAEKLGLGRRSHDVYTEGLVDLVLDGLMPSGK